SLQPTAYSLQPVMSSRRPWLLPVLVTLLVLLGPEVALRIAKWPPLPSSHGLPHDPDTLWTLPREGPVAGTPAHVNEYGLRGPDLGRKRRGERRIACLGDSSVFGVGVADDQTFCARLAASFPATEALNAGVPGYSTEEVLRQFPKRVAPARPDLVVVATLWSDNNMDTFVDAELFAQAGRRMAGPGALLVPIARHSATVRAAARLAGVETTRTVHWGTIGQGQGTGRRRVPLASYAENLLRIADLSRQADAEVVFLVLANEEDLRPGVRPWPWDPYREVMRATARRLDTLRVEGARAFRAAGGGRDLLLDAMHPSARGHEALALALAEGLTARGWDRGRAVMGDDGPLVVVPVDPWQAPAPEGTSHPAIAGVILAAPDLRQPVRIEAVHPVSGAILDAVDLPSPAAFALDVPPQPVRLRARTRALGPSPIELGGDPVFAGRAWGLRVDLHQRRVHVPGDAPPLPR
ncbi:MAG: SGNH/GDSL hydrolase family protein, partial [Deltaproteobacteria bacterium]|nr:SGNH/GDSL hydrolase family protein [Deltaproteobacteria bacterium]